MVAENQAPARWKSEEDLYRLVLKYYPDARFHHTPTWIKPQYYDVYVPSINTAFEYQGQQHFKAIDYFGGESSFAKMVQLDLRKKKLTLDNGVRLIEWMFDEPITKMLLDKKLARF